MYPGLQIPQYDGEVWKGNAQVVVLHRDLEAEWFDGEHLKSGSISGPKSLRSVVSRLSTVFRGEEGKSRSEGEYLESRHCFFFLACRKIGKISHFCGADSLMDTRNCYSSIQALWHC